MTKIKYLFIVLLGLFFAFAMTMAPTQAKDITWGKTVAPQSQQKDITWGKTAPQQKDITWGKSAPGTIKIRDNARARGECSWYAGCGGIQHYAPDDGYDPAFLVRCQYGDPASNRWVPEGANGNMYCADVDEVQVGSGQQIVCMSTYGWQVRYDATGWHKIYDGQNPLCVMQLD